LIYGEKAVAVLHGGKTRLCHFSDVAVIRLIEDPDSGAEYEHRSAVNVRTRSRDLMVILGDIAWYAEVRNGTTAPCKYRQFRLRCWQLSPRRHGSGATALHPSGTQ